MNTRKIEINTISLGISILITSLITCLFISSSNEFIHWFIIPVYLCGVLILIDAVDWARGKMRLFDPIGFVGLFGYHFFFIAPLLHVFWKVEMLYVENPEDWRVWIGILSVINLLGLILYQTTRSFFINRIAIKRTDKKDTYSVWEVDKKRANVLLVGALTFTFILQTFIYLKMGGISGYVRVYTQGEGSFSGLGWLFMLAESFPVLLVIYIAININDKEKKSLIYVILLFIVIFLIRLYFGGLRGSRSNTIWVLIWVAGIIHFWIRPLSRKLLMAGLVIVLLFAFVYGVFKGSREDFAKAFNNDVTIIDLAQENNRGIQTLLLGDLARTGIQSYIIYKQINSPQDYKLAYGRSYIGDFAIVIPKSIWHSRPPTVVKEGTEILRGMGSFIEGGYTSSRIHGLQGEFTLNFGYVFSFFAYLFFAFYIAKIRSLLFVLKNRDSRTFIYPFLVITCFLVLVQDMDNFVFGTIKNLSFPLLIVLLSTRKVTYNTKVK